MKRLLSSITFSALVLVPTFAQAAGLFKYRNKEYNVTDLDPKTQGKFFEAEYGAYTMHQRLADDAVLEMYFAEIAKKDNKTVEQVQADKLKVGEPSEKEIKAFYEENKARIPYPYDQVKGELGRYVKEKKVTEARTKLLEKVKKETGYAFLMPEPQAPVVTINTDGFASRGKQDAKVTLVEFADYKCGHCKDASKALKKIYSKYEGKVKFVFVDFPIIGDSQKIAEGAFCASKQNKYWQYNELAYEEQGKIDKAEDFAKKLKLDDKQFKECMDKNEGQAIVQKGKAEGDRLGLTGTPSIFVNGRKILSYTPEGLTQELDKALKAANAS